MANILPSPPLFGLTSGRLIVATGAASVGNSNFTASGNTLDLAAAGSLGIGTGVATEVVLGGANTALRLGPIAVAGTGFVQMFNPFYFSALTSSAGAQLQNTNGFNFAPHYWTGAADLAYNITLRGVMDSTAPAAHLALQFNGAEKFQFTSNGNIITNLVDSFAGNSLNLGISNATAVNIGGPSTTSMTLEAKSIQLIGSDVANGSYPYTNTINAYSGGAPIFGVFNAGVLKAYVDSNGSLISVAGSGNPGFVLSQAAAFYAYPALSDTIGANTLVQGGNAGAVSAAAGKQGGTVLIEGSVGPAGTAALAAGSGGHAWIIGGNAGANNGGGGANGGYVYIQPGAGTGAGSNGVISILDTASVGRGFINPSGTTWLYPADDNVRTLGGSANRWLNVYTSAISTGNVAATNTTAMTIAPNVADGASSIGLAITPATALLSGTAVAVNSNGLTTNTSPGVSLRNNTPATSGVQQQNSPTLELAGTGWGTSAGTSQTTKVAWQIQPQSGSTPAPRLALMSSVNGAAYSASAPLAIFTTEGGAGNLFPALTNSGLIFSGLGTTTPVISGGGDGNVGIEFGASARLFYAGGFIEANSSGIFSNTTIVATGNITANGGLGFIADNGLDTATGVTLPIGTATASAVSIGNFSGSGAPIFVNSNFVYGGAQSVAAATSVTIQSALSVVHRISLSATAITSLTVNTGHDGQRLIVEVIQDGTGSRTIPTTWTNVAFAGGSYTRTTTAGKRDVLTFLYNSGLGKWVEVSRAMNI